MVSIQQISCAARPKSSNLQSQTGNFVAHQSGARKLLNYCCMSDAGLRLRRPCWFRL